jgi:hypothetical protein
MALPELQQAWLVHFSEHQGKGSGCYIIHRAYALLSSLQSEATSCAATVGCGGTLEGMQVSCASLCTGLCDNITMRNTPLTLYIMA